MPNNTKASHPSGKLEITFTEDDHSYIDSFGIEYISTTTLIHQAFEPFNAETVAQTKSAKTGVPAEQYLQEWQASSRTGTRMHENCERQILNRISEMHQPESDEERLRFRAAWREVEKIKNAFAVLEPEKIIFSPRFLIAGSVDLLAYRNGEFFIFDWKNIKELRYQAFGNRTGLHLTTQHLPDANFYHYSLQLAIYEWILKTEGYIPFNATVHKYLNVYNQTSATFQPTATADLRLEALSLMAHHITNDGLEPVPF